MFKKLTDLSQPEQEEEPEVKKAVFDWSTKGKEFAERVYSDSKVAKILKEYRSRQEGAINGGVVDQSFLILKIRLDEEIVKVEDRLREQ